MSSRRLFVALAVVALGASATACSNEIDDAELEKSITERAEEAFDGYDVGEVDCPEGVEIEAGNVFECTLEIEGETATIVVTQQDDEGNVTIEQAEAVLDVATIVEEVTSGILQQTGTEVTVDCGSGTVRIQEPGDSFECDATAVDGSGTATVNVVVVDVEGNIEWEVV
jgi:Domain of unknown function (DUF4333)